MDRSRSAADPAQELNGAFSGVHLTKTVITPSSHTESSWTESVLS